jgi:hypothetical protein
MYTIGEVLHSIQEIPLVYKGLCGIIAITWVLNSRRKRVSHHLVEYHIIDYVLPISKADIPTYGGILSFSSILSTIRLNLQGADWWLDTYAHVCSIFSFLYLIIITQFILYYFTSGRFSLNSDVVIG